MELHTNIRWLSRNKFLQSFQDLWDELIKLLEGIGNDFQQLCDLVFLADFTKKLSLFDLEQPRTSPGLDLRLMFSNEKNPNFKNIY